MLQTNAGERIVPSISQCNADLEIIMRVLQRNTLDIARLEGRTLQKAVGKHAASPSKKMTMGFARYSAETGPMQPHHHAEEVVLVLSADRSWVRYGLTPEELGPPISLLVGTVLHVPELEWHVFEYERGGHLEIAYFYGQVDNIRPEDIRREDIPDTAEKG
jgi:hypothetical protein